MYSDDEKVLSISQVPSVFGDTSLNVEEPEPLIIKKPRKKFRGAWHDPRFTKVTSTVIEKRKKKKIERQRRKAGR